jgi:dihydroorotate dehydrogenase (fumarate)
MDLRTTFLGLELRNPLVPSSSPLSRDLDMAKRLEDAGASALVMYSLFEEEIERENNILEQLTGYQDIGHDEASSYLPMHGEYKTGLEDYLEQLQRLKTALDIPVVASLNGISLDDWVEHGKELEQTGADALELNIYYVAANPDESSAAVEARYIELLSALRREVSLPISMKLSPQFSSIGHMIKRLEQAGANGVVLFNRFYQPDIDLESLQVIPRLHLSNSRDALLAMRWIAILYGRVNLSLAATGGIHNAEDALKMLLAGADVVYLCATLLQNGPKQITDMLHDMGNWLEVFEYDSIEQLKGSVSQKNVSDPVAFERANYVELLTGYEPPPPVRH